MHGVSIDAATLPAGWEERTIDVAGEYWTKGNVGRCLETHDLAASKLYAYRDKNRAVVRTLLTEGMLDGDRLIQRLSALPVAPAEVERLTTWVRVTEADLSR